MDASDWDSYLLDFVKWFSEDLFQKKLDQTISAAVSALYYPGQQGNP